MERLNYTWLIYGMLFNCTRVWASGAEAAGEAEHEAPGIFSGDIFTAIFTLAVFLLVLFIVGKWAWGPILTGLQKREEHIRRAIEIAEKKQVEAEKNLAEYQQQLAQANEESRTIIERGRAEAVRLAEDLQQKAQNESQRLRQQAERDINSAKKQALREIYQQTTDLATEMAGTILGRTIGPEDHRDLLQKALNKLQQDEAE